MCFVLTKRGMEVNSYKCLAIIYMSNPSNVKEFQQLTSSLTAIYRFLSSIGDKVFDLFAMLKKKGKV